MSSNSLPSTQGPPCIHIVVEWENTSKNVGLQHKNSPIMDNCALLRQGGSDVEGQTWLIAFRWNHVKLAWALINIMNAIHHCGILHNNLSKDNIMLHFPLNKLDVVYIGMCNWGEVGRLQEVMSSLYGFAKEQDATNSKIMQLVDCTIIGFCL